MVLRRPAALDVSVAHAVWKQSTGETFESRHVIVPAARLVELTQPFVDRAGCVARSHLHRSAGIPVAKMQRCTAATSPTNESALLHSLERLAAAEHSAPPSKAFDQPSRRDSDFRPASGSGLAGGHVYRGCADTDTAVARLRTRISITEAGWSVLTLGAGQT
jgi:hypothetical protein